MKQFTFQLTTLLRLRESARDGRRGFLAEALRAEEILSQRMGDLTTEINDFSSQYALPTEGLLQVDHILEAQRYELLLRAELQNVAAQREQVEQEIATRREALTEADRNVRVLEKLRERQAKKHRYEEMRQEQRELDEVASQQWWREVAT